VRSLTSRLFRPCSRIPEGHVVGSTQPGIEAVLLENHAPIRPGSAHRAIVHVDGAAAGFAPRPAIKRITVDFPEPELPTSATNSPELISRLMFLEHEFAVAALAERFADAFNRQMHQIAQRQVRRIKQAKAQNRSAGRISPITISPTKISSVRRKRWARLIRLPSPSLAATSFSHDHQIPGGRHVDPISIKHLGSDERRPPTLVMICNPRPPMVRADSSSSRGTN